MEINYRIPDPKDCQEGSRDEGAIGWYVETDDPMPNDGIYLGDLISINADGKLFIWDAKDSMRHSFEPGQWKFVFPRFFVDEVKGGVYRTRILQDGDTGVDKPSKLASFVCSCGCGQPITAQRAVGFHDDIAPSVGALTKRNLLN
jgi:hypothetical protein